MGRLGAIRKPPSRLRIPKLGRTAWFAVPEILRGRL